MKKKILFILHLPNPLHGSSMVGSQIHHSKNINESFSTRYVNLNTSDSLGDIGKFNFTKVVKYVIIVTAVVKNLIFRKPDLVYIAITARGMAFYKDSLLVLICKIFKRPIIYHFNNKGVSSSQNIKFQYWFYTKVFHKTKAIVLSDLLYSDIKSFFSKDQVDVCPYGVKDESSDAIIDYRTKAAEEGNNKTILYLGNLIRSKGCLILLEACNILKSNGLDFKCNLIGGEGDLSALQINQEIKKMNLQNHVFYIGKKTGKEKNTFFKDADVFAFPTYYPFEAFPIVNIEAMQWGLPVVSTYEGGIPDEVIDGETGFLVHQHDTRALAEKLELLLSDKHLRLKMSKSSRYRYKSNYTLSAFEHRMKFILEKAV